MIDNAQYVYAEHKRLVGIARQHQTSYEFWGLALEALKDEKVFYLDSMWEYRDKERDIKGKIRRNKKMHKKHLRLIKKLRRRYRMLRELKGEYLA